MKLRIHESKISYYAFRYNAGSDKIIENLVPEVKQRGYLKKSELLTLSGWKIRAGNRKENNRKNIERNEDYCVEEMTRFSLMAETEKARLNCLLGLDGVGVPVASVILHWFHDDDYPIWDFRALESVGVDRDRKKITFDRWLEYVLFCRDVAKRNDVSMRTLDRALWQYSKE